MAKLSNVIPGKEITGFDEQFNVCMLIISMLQICMYVYTYNSFVNGYLSVYYINHASVYMMCILNIAHVSFDFIFAVVAKCLSAVC